MRLGDVPDKTLVYIGVRRWVIECKVPVVRVEVSESDLRSSKLHGEDTRYISYDRVTKKKGSISPSLTLYCTPSPRL